MGDVRVDRAKISRGRPARFLSKKLKAHPREQHLEPLETTLVLAYFKFSDYASQLNLGMFRNG